MSGIVDDLLGDFGFSIAVSNPPNRSIELFSRPCDALFTAPGLRFLLEPPKASKKDMSFDDNQESIVSDLDTGGDVKGEACVCSGGELTNSID